MLKLSAHCLNRQMTVFEFDLRDRTVKTYFAILDATDRGVGKETLKCMHDWSEVDHTVCRGHCYPQATRACCSAICLSTDSVSRRENADRSLCMHALPQI